MPNDDPNGEFYDNFRNQGNHRLQFLIETLSLSKQSDYFRKYLADVNKTWRRWDCFRRRKKRRRDDDIEFAADGSLEGSQRQHKKLRESPENSELRRLDVWAVGVTGPSLNESDSPVPVGQQQSAVAAVQ